MRSIKDKYYEYDNQIIHQNIHIPQRKNLIITEEFNKHYLHELK